MESAAAVGRVAEGGEQQGHEQGWDLHPGQLPTRDAATYAFFFGGLAAASERLSNFMAKAAQATLVGDVFDDAEALRAGVTLEELRGRSFVRILKNRRGLA